MYSKVAKLKTDYSEKLLSGEMPSNPVTIGITAFNLTDYGLLPTEHIKTATTEKAIGFEYELRIELTPNEIIITFGKGLDGDVSKTLIVEVTKISENGVYWSCLRGTLSQELRPVSAAV